MNNITVRRGESLQLPITIDDESAVNVTLQIIKDDTEVVRITEYFVDKNATIFIEEVIIPVDEYKYMLTVVYSDGVIDKLPDISDCHDSGCDLPNLIVCEGIFESIS